jgi:PAS domain-containing protein
MRVVAPLLRRHALALLVTALAFIFTLVLWPFGHRFPFALFIAAVLAAAWQGGPRSALLTTALASATLFGLYFLLSAEQIAELGFDYLTRLALFVFVGLVASFLCWQYQRADSALGQAAAILSQAGEGLILVDERGQVTSINDIAEKLTAWTPKEAVGHPVEQVFHLRAATGEPLETPVASVLGDGSARPLPSDAVVMALMSGCTPVEGAVAPRHDSADRLTGVIISFRDVSDRKQAEAAARSSEERLQQALVEHRSANEAALAQGQQLDQALAGERQSREKSESDLRSARAELEKANQALIVARARTDEAVLQVRTDYEKRLEEQAQLQTQAEEVLRQAEAKHERGLAEMAAAHEQNAAALQQSHAQVSEQLAEALGRHGRAEEALRNAQAELSTLKQQHDAAQEETASALQRAQAEGEGALRQVHADWEQRLAEREAEHARLHEALKRELADHQELFKELDQEEQSLRQERDLYLSLLVMCAMPAIAESQLRAPRPQPAVSSPVAFPCASGEASHPSFSTEGEEKAGIEEPALAAVGNGAASVPATASDEGTARLDWLSFN